MNKRILTLCLALILCLSLVPEQCFAVSAPKQAVIKEAPVAGEMAFRPICSSCRRSCSVGVNFMVYDIYVINSRLGC